MIASVTITPQVQGSQIGCLHPPAKAGDVMTRDVITVSPESLAQDVAGILFKHRISAVPVIDAGGRIVGIVSESDLMHRAEVQTESVRSWWLQALRSRETLAAEYIKAHARKVSDVMTTNVITATPGTPLRDLAALLDRHHIKRVPIVEEGKLVGIVSRADLIRAFASVHAVGEAREVADDAAIRERVIGQLRSESWANLNSLNIVVNKGVVELWGAISSEAEHRAIRIAAENTAGVRAVEDHLAMGQFKSSV